MKCTDCHRPWCIQPKTVHWNVEASQLMILDYWQRAVKRTPRIHLGHVYDNSCSMTRSLNMEPCLRFSNQIWHITWQTGTLLLKHLMIIIIWNKSLWLTVANYAWTMYTINWKIRLGKLSTETHQHLFKLLVDVTFWHAFDSVLPLHHHGFHLAIFWDCSRAVTGTVWLGDGPSFPCSSGGWTSPAKHGTVSMSRGRNQSKNA